MKNATASQLLASCAMNVAVRKVTTTAGSRLLLLEDEKKNVERPRHFSLIEDM
jgi:hypothetical protein